MRLTLNYVCTVISACTYPYNTNTFTHISQKCIYCNWKLTISEWSFFWNQKIFHLGIKEISTVKSCINYFNKLVLINKLIKLSADISDSSFLLDSLSKAKIFPNFSAGNSFLFFKRFWNVRLSDRCHFISYCKFSCLKKVSIIIFTFSVLQHKNKCFW